MYASTVSNEDGTFSPAIVFEQEMWIRKDQKGTEDAMAALANSTLDDCKASVIAQLLDGKYKKEA